MKIVIKILFTVLTFIFFQQNLILREHGRELIALPTIFLNQFILLIVYTVGLLEIQAQLFTPPMGEIAGLFRIVKL